MFIEKDTKKIVYNIHNVSLVYYKVKRWLGSG